MGCVPSVPAFWPLLHQEGDGSISIQLSNHVKQHNKENRETSKESMRHQRLVEPYWLKVMMKLAFLISSKFRYLFGGGGSVGHD